MTSTLHEDHGTFWSCSMLHIMKNVSDTSWGENQNFSFFFFGSCHLWDNVEKYCRAGQVTDDTVAYPHCMLDT